MIPVKYATTQTSQASQNVKISCSGDEYCHEAKWLINPYNQIAMVSATILPQQNEQLSSILHKMFHVWDFLDDGKPETQCLVSM